MTDQIDKIRRIVLHGLTVGGAAITARRLPGAWTRPVVETVILPAHAQERVSAQLLREPSNRNHNPAGRQRDEHVAGDTASSLAGFSDLTAFLRPHE